MSLNPYGNEKVLHHLDKLIDLKEGVQPNPTHVQLIISDYCNQNCNFCFPFGRVKTPDGSKEISQIEVGDMVLNINKEPKMVTHVFKRPYFDKVVVITSKNNQLVCTKEHPIHTDRGYVSAEDLTDHNIWTTNGLQRITDIYMTNWEGYVYNLEVEQENYVINGVSVHNCAYRMDGYSSNELFKVIEEDKVNNNPRRMIPWVKLEELVNDFADMRVKAVQLTGGGEATVHPDFDKLCKLILSKGIDLSLVTNGLLLKESRAAILADCAWIRVSVDCGNRDTYAKIRDVPPEEFDIVAKNVTRLSRMPRKTLLGVGYVITRDNYRELYEGCVKFKEWGVDNVRISAIFQNDGAAYFKDFYDEVLAQIAMCKTLEDDKFKIFDKFGSRHEDLELGNPDYSFCPYMHFTTYIGGDQNVYTCCVNSYNPKGFIGSIKNQSFKKLWQGNVKQKFFKNFDAKNCERCMFNEKNRFINKLLVPATPHDNFV